LLPILNRLPHHKKLIHVNRRLLLIDNPSHCLYGLITEQRERVSSMSQQNEKEESDELNVADMRSWLRLETKHLSKALELRMKEATEIVTSYAAGEITPQQAGERFWNYSRRWPEALPGVFGIGKMSDEEIVAEVDTSRDPQRRSQWVRDRMAALSRNKEGQDRER